MIGELVKEYNLGHLLPTVNASSLIYAYYQLDKGLLNKPDNTYCSTHTVDKFNEAIVDIIDCNYRWNITLIYWICSLTLFYLH